MLSFIGSLIALVVGYIVYGKIVGKIFGAKEGKETPAYSKMVWIMFHLVGRESF